MVRSVTAADLVPVAHQIARRERAIHGIDYDDVLSDALYGLALATHRCDPTRPLEPFARATMEGVILHGKRDRAGRYRQSPRPELVELEDDTVSSHQPGPYEQAMRRDLWERIDRTLDARSRLVVRLYYQWDLSQNEIAAVIGVSQMQVSRLLQTARERLADHIAA